MARLTWDDVGSRTFEYGVDRGVLYVNSIPYGVAWNGLTNVSTNTKSTESTPYYIDGVKYYNEPGIQDFVGSITAFTYPDEFSLCEGIDYDFAGSGLGYDMQDPEPFGLSYRTQVGNDTDGTDHAYKLHIVYNALASAADRAHSTVTDNPETATFSWNFTTSPVLVEGRRPTAHFILDSRFIKSDSLANIERILYGTPTLHPRLPKASDLIKALDDWMGFTITPSTSGLGKLSPTGIDDLIGNTEDGLFTAASGGRLVQTETPGLYRLE